MAGCNSSNFVFSEKQQERLEELENKVLVLEQINEHQQETIDELSNLRKNEILERQKTYSSFQRQFLGLELNMLVNRVLVYQLFSTQTAILNEVDIKDGKLEMRMIFAEFILDDQAPNGFRLEYAKDETTISISENVPIYILDRTNELVPKRIEFEEFVDERGFYELFELNGEIVFILEQYIP